MNATVALTSSSPDFIRRVVIQDFILASLAPYRVTFPESMIDCDDPSCIAVRIHDNVEYTIVPPSNWSKDMAIPEYSSMWKSEFDVNHQWDSLNVDDAVTLQLEFSPLAADVNFESPDCQIYGYPYLALQICLKEGPAPHTVFLGISQLNETYNSRIAMC
jgi:hypothetical protein